MKAIEDRGPQQLLAIKYRYSHDEAILEVSMKRTLPGWLKLIKLLVAAT